MADDYILAAARMIEEQADPPLRNWRKIARPKQLPPDDPRHHEADAKGFRCGCDGTDSDYSIFLLLAGRGLGKTLAGANWSIEQALATPGIVGAVVGPTFRDTRNTCFEGSSGILKQLQKGELKQWRRHELRLDLSNGSAIFGFSADQPERLRGSNLGFAWCEELGSWRYDEAWHEGLIPALRIGDNPRIVVTTTPRPTKLIRSLLGRKDRSVHVTRGSTWENADNLSSAALAELRRRYEGTRLGRQELEGELLDDTPGSLWRRDDIDAARVGRGEVPDLVRIVVAIDPAVTSGEDADETGIVVAGEDGNGHAYVLADLSTRGSPEGCMRRAVNAYREFDADCIVAEANNGGDYLGTVLRTVDPQVPYRQVRASRGKAIRAEPVASLAEQHRLHHVGAFPELEDQMCGFVPDMATGHDDRLDACIAAGTPVITARGQVPIEDVRAGDLAWTRQGWKPVLAARCTRRNAEVMTAGLSSGGTLTATPDHRVWVEGRGWTRMDALVWGDRLSAWQSPPSRSFTGASSTSATRTPGSVPTAFTTALREAAAGTRSTATSGATATLARRSRAAGTSTTATTTPSTTTRATSCCAPRRGTLPSIPRSRGSRESTWPPSGPLPHSGTGPMRALPGTASTASGPGKIASRWAPALARSAALSSRRGSIAPATAPAPASAGSPSGGSGVLRPALSAAPASCKIARGTSGPAPVHVLRSYASGLADVYDLMVADAHEFTAAGVIVHNCVWAVSELRGVSSGSWLAAYGVSKCDSCGEAWPSRDGGLCPRCNPGQPRVRTLPDPAPEREPEEVGGWASAYGDFVRCPACTRPFDKRRHDKCPNCRQGALSVLQQYGRPGAGPARPGGMPGLSGIGGWR